MVEVPRVTALAVAPSDDGQGDVHLTAQSVAVMRPPRPRLPHAPVGQPHIGPYVGQRRAPARPMPPLRRSAIALPRPAKALGNALSIAPSSALIQYGILGLKVVAGALAGATVALAFMNYESRQPGAPAFEPARNETVVYRRATPPKSYARLEQADEVAVEPADPAEPVLTSHTSYYERPVQTVSFTNSNVDQPRSIFEVTRAAIAKALVKVGGFVAYRSTTETAEPEIAPRKRTGGIMDEV